MDGILIYALLVAIVFIVGTILKGIKHNLDLKSEQRREERAQKLAEKQTEKENTTLEQYEQALRKEKRLQVEYKGETLLLDMDEAEQLLQHVTYENNLKKNQETEPPQADWLTEYPKDFVEVLLHKIRINPQATWDDEIEQGIGEFGIEVTNPVPVYGVPDMETYLRNLKNSLCTDDEIVSMQYKVVNWHKDVKNLTSDVAEVFTMSTDSKGNLYGGTVFLSPAHWRTSAKAPQGFVYAKEYFDKDLLNTGVLTRKKD